MTPHGQRAHAILGASSCDRWWNCPGSVRLSEAIPEAASPYAQAGTAFHELMERCLKGNRDPAEFLGFPVDVSTDTLAAEVRIDEEMVGAAKEVIAALKEGWSLSDDDRVFIEQRFTLEKLNPPAPMFGTADLVIYNRASRLLRVIDFKYGAGVAVDVKDNPQLRYYALGAMLALGERVSRVTMTIAQPRAWHADGPIRSDAMDAEDLLEWSVYLIAKAAETQKPDAPLQAGDWCRWCPAQGACPALADRALKSAMVEFGDLDAITIPPTPDALTVDQLVRVLDHASEIKDWLNAVAAYATNLLERGGSVPGYKLVAKRPGPRKWKDDAAAVKAIPILADIDPSLIFDPPKLKTPAALEKVVGKAGMADLADLIKQESSGVNLVREEVARPAVPASVHRDFQPLEDE